MVLRSGEWSIGRALLVGAIRAVLLLLVVWAVRRRHDAVGIDILTAIDEHLWASHGSVAERAARPGDSVAHPPNEDD